MRRRTSSACSESLLVGARHLQELARARRPRGSLALAKTETRCSSTRNPVLGILTRDAADILFKPEALARSYHDANTSPSTFTTVCMLGGALFLIAASLLMSSPAHAACQVTPVTHELVKINGARHASGGATRSGYTQPKILFVQLRQDRTWRSDKLLQKARFTVTNGTLRVRYKCAAVPTDKEIFSEAWVQGESKTQSGRRYFKC